jgi:DNA-binding MarR family transcriptional regulator
MSNDTFTGVVDLVHKLSKKFNHLYGGVIGNEGITFAQYCILNVLWQKDGIPLNEFANTCCCRRSTVTGVVDTMEKRGLVVRDRDSTDRRVILLRLTEKGKALKSKLSGMRKLFNQCCSYQDITKEELKELHRLLDKLDKAVLE